MDKSIYNFASLTFTEYFFYSLVLNFLFVPTNIRILARRMRRLSPFACHIPSLMIATLLLFDDCRTPIALTTEQICLWFVRAYLKL
jgi:hypothetical protein